MYKGFNSINVYCINVLTVGDGGHLTVLDIRCHLLRQVHVPDRSADLRRGRLPPAILAKLVPLPRSRACHLPEDNRLYSLIENPLTKRLLSCLYVHSKLFVS